MFKVVFYSRVSTDEEKQLNALEKQIQELTDFIKSNSDWLLVDNYIDEGKSGTRAIGRKQYQRLFSDLLTDKFDIIVIKDISRLMRNITDWCLFIDRLQQNEKKLFLYLDNKFYVPEDKFITGIKAMMAEEYSRDLSRKINSAAKRSQSAGTVYGNGKILGYHQKDGKLTINEDEAIIIRQIFQWYIDGLGFFKISNKLDEMGIKSSTGTKFSQSTLKRMIKQEKYRGLLVSGKTKTNFETHTITKTSESERIYIQDGCPRIVSDEIWLKANEILNSRRIVNKMNEFTGVHTGDEYPLSGKIICGKCGKSYWHNSYTTKVNQLHRSVWNCSTYRSQGIKGCQNTVLQDEVIMKLTKEVMFNAITDDGVKLALKTLTKVLRENNKQSDENNTDVLISKYQKLKHKKENLLDFLLDGTINKEQYANKSAELDAQMNSINEMIEASHRNNEIANMSVEKRIDMINNFLATHYDSPEHIPDNDVKTMIQKIVVNDKQLDIYLAMGQMETVLLDTSASGTQRTHPTEKFLIYETRKRRTTKRDSSNWLYFKVYFVA